MKANMKRSRLQLLLFVLVVGMLLGDKATAEETAHVQLLGVAPYTEFKGDKSTASWFPDEEFAKVWQRYGQEEPVKRKPARKD